MSICDNCIHLKVCGHEGVEDAAMTYCADKEERPNEYDWCKGCKEHDEEHHCCHRLSNFIHTQAQEIHDMAYEEGKNDRPTGEWIEYEEYNGDTYYECSHCREPWTTIEGSPMDNLMHYCPNCGARMSEVVRND